MTWRHWFGRKSDVEFEADYRWGYGVAVESGSQSKMEIKI